MSKVPPFLMVGHGRRGRGVFATRDIPPDTLIESCPVVLVPRSEVGSGQLSAYVFLWGGEQGDRYALPAGHGLLFNHDPQPNARFDVDLEGHRIDFRSSAAIPAGSEVVVDYDYDPEHLAVLEHPEWYRAAPAGSSEDPRGDLPLRRWDAGEALPFGTEGSLRSLLVGCFGADADETPVACDWRWMILDEGRRPVAHVAVRRMQGAHAATGHLAYAATAPELRRRGLASRLLSQVQTDAAGLGLSAIVLQAEPAAVACYRRLGWEPVSSRARFRDSGETDGDPVLAWAADPRRVAGLVTACFEFDSAW